jgi:hypothetical protein
LNGEGEYVVASTKQYIEMGVYVAGELKVKEKQKCKIRLFEP